MVINYKIKLFVFYNHNIYKTIIYYNAILNFAFVLCLQYQYYLVFFSIGTYRTKGNVSVACWSSSAALQVSTSSTNKGKASH